jgi:hypothetical protein
MDSCGDSTDSCGDSGVAKLMPTRLQRGFAEDARRWIGGLPNGSERVERARLRLASWASKKLQAALTLKEESGGPAF